MRASFGPSGVTFYRDASDPKFSGLRFAKGEHALLHFIKRWLNQRGFLLIKKRAQKDGHLIGDIHQPYLRCREPQASVPHVYLWSGFYQLRGAEEDWNGGTVSLRLETDVFGIGQDTMAIIARLCRQHPHEMRVECRVLGLHR
jgi:hypothetical protein